MKIFAPTTLFCALLFALSAPVFFATARCGLVKSAPMAEVVRDIHATWDEDGRHLLLAESRYRTSRPNEPYFNAPSARDWEIRLYEIGPLPGRLTPAQLAALLKERRAIGGWSEEAEPGGSLMSGPLYWLRESGRVIGVENQQPFLFDIKNSERYDLAPPADRMAEHVGAELSEGAFGRSPTPSPDGKTVAVFFTAPYQTGGDLAPIQFKHFVAFFAAADGRYLSSQKIDFGDPNIDPALTPHAPGLPLRYQFLWSRDSSSVFVLSRARAFAVSVDPTVAPRTVKQVPARAVPTRSGPVSPAGAFVFLAENHSAPNERRLELRRVSDWLSFERVGLIAHPTMRYSVP